MTNEPFLLEPDCGEPIPLTEFLKQAATDESMFDSVWRRAKRKRDAGGFHSPAGEGADPKPDPYLLMLAAEGIQSWKVFDGIEGNEYTVEEMFKEEPTDLMIAFVGPPGGGKSKIILRVMSLVLGESFYMVHGCPNNCAPRSLLKLLGEEGIRKLPKEFGDTGFLLSLHAHAVTPCDHCLKQIFGERTQPTQKPDLSTMKIQAVRLLDRAGHGVVSWTPSPDEGAVPLDRALHQGTHLAILSQPFAQDYKGKTPPIHPLLEAVQGQHQLQDGTPYAGLVFLETNEQGWTRFLKDVMDVGAYKRRMLEISRGYVTQISREVRIYQTYLKTLPESTRWDPLVLEAVAVLAVFSRIQPRFRLDKDDRLSERKETLDRRVRESIQQRMRMLDGDLALLEVATAGDANVVSAPRYTTGTDCNARLRLMLAQLRNFGRFRDGFEGLNQPFMMNEIVKPLVSLGRALGGGVTFLNAMQLMAGKLEEQKSLKDADAGDSQKKMYDACLNELKLAEPKREALTIEDWYRRRLMQLVELAFFPDRDERRDLRFTAYFTLATAVARGDTRYTDATDRQVVITEKLVTEVLDPVEKLIDTINSRGSSSVKEYRQALQGRADMYLRAEAQRLSLGSAAPVLEPTWDTLPELKRAISTLQAQDDFAKIAPCLKDHSGDKPLTHEQLKLRDAGLRNLQGFGFSPESLNEVLRYIRANELWTVVSTSHNHF
jgi:hypothetical protein